MTSTTDTSGHPDVAEISDLTEGLLPPSRSSAVRQHLEACALCADVHASLEEIRGLLGAVSGPPRMPDDVAHRIDAALAAESLPSATASEATSTSEDGLPVSIPESDVQPAPYVSRETSAGTSRPAGHARSATTGPGRKEHARGRRRTVAALSTVFAVAALGLGSFLVSSLTEDSGSGTSAHPSASTAVDTFAHSTLEQQVTELLATTQGSKSPGEVGIQGEPEGPSTRAFRQPTVPPCVQKGIGQSGTALAVEQGRYQGRDALLVVLPDPSDATRVNVYLMDATCVRQGSAGPAELLLKDTYTQR
ncbi:anti-sigma factor family protein [Streptomyces sp. NPDC017936]|uniref:anti-sigma factor family protein n=1 Tax=Streptomyces sp. NPDC017936 TaxID=3365016 RepID=UPI003794731D